MYPLCFRKQTLQLTPQLPFKADLKHLLRYFIRGFKVYQHVKHCCNVVKLSLVIQFSTTSAIKQQLSSVSV